MAADHTRSWDLHVLDAISRLHLSQGIPNIDPWNYGHHAYHYRAGPAPSGCIIDRDFRGLVPYSATGRSGTVLYE